MTMPFDERRLAPADVHDQAEYQRHVGLLPEILDRLSLSVVPQNVVSALQVLRWSAASIGDQTSHGNQAYVNPQVGSLLSGERRARNENRKERNVRGKHSSARDNTSPHVGCYVWQMLDGHKRPPLCDYAYYILRTSPRYASSLVLRLSLRHTQHRPHALDDLWPDGGTGVDKNEVSRLVEHRCVHCVARALRGRLISWRLRGEHPSREKLLPHSQRQHLDW